MSAASTPYLVVLTAMLIGCITDEEGVPAQLLNADRSPSHRLLKRKLTCRVGEANDNLVRHCAWEVGPGSDRLVMVSNDTDTTVCLLFALSLHCEICVFKNCK